MCRPTHRCLKFSDGRVIELLGLGFILMALNAYFFPFAFDPLPTDHYGWVNFHFMSILQNTTKDNYFVGYTYLAQSEGGSVEPHYFNRYSPLTDIILQSQLSGLGLVDKILALKVFFRSIFVINCACIYVIGRTVGLGSVAAASLTFFIGSQYYFIYPSDMAHFDQMALLGLFVQIVLIMKKRLLTFFVFTLFAIHLGRNFMLILTSLFFYSCMLYKHRDKSYVFLFFIHLASFVSSFAYNVAIEMHVTGKNLLDTSILNTFQHRTAQPPGDQADWIFYLKIMFERIGHGILLNKGPTSVAKLIGGAAIIALISTICLIAVRGISDCTFLTVLLPPLVFFVVGRNLVFFHDYTLMWLIPMFTYFFAKAAAFEAPLATRIFESDEILRVTKTFFLLMSVAYFCTSLYLDKSWKERTHANGLIQKIQAQAVQVKSGDMVCVEEINKYQLQSMLPGAIYAKDGCNFLLNRNGVVSK
jgi:hypothetical protein